MGMSLFGIFNDSVPVCHLFAYEITFTESVSSVQLKTVEVGFAEFVLKWLDCSLIKKG